MELEGWRKKLDGLGYAARPGSHWKLEAGPGGRSGLLLPFAPLDEAEWRTALALFQRALPKPLLQNGLVTAMAGPTEGPAAK